MADINVLRASAQRKLDNGDALFPLDAAEKAIKGSGIFYGPDLKRLKPQVARGLKVPKKRKFG